MIVSLSLDEELVGTIKEIASDNKRKVSAQVEIFIRQALKERDRQKKKNKKQKDLQ